MNQRPDQRFRNTFRRALGTGALATFAILAIAGRAGAVTPKTLTWEELVPPEVIELETKAGAMQREFLALDTAVRKNYQKVAHELSVRDRLAAKSVTEGELSTADLEVLQANPVAKYPEAAAFWAEVKSLNDQLKASNDAVDPQINGQTVRLPGYVLPIELDGTQVQEFLLVPYVGACIHTPPPPANQMVYVRVPAGFESQGLYTPVWVEGTMLAEPARYDVSFSDGNRAVAAGYSLDATKIELYEQ